jgi:DNA-binding beta-propeller fold protein YncE
VLGTGEHCYQAVPWPLEPHRLDRADVASVAVDAADTVITFSRQRQPLSTFRPSGHHVETFGEGVFTNPHGLAIAPDGALWCADDGDHTVRRLTPGGEVTLVVGEAGRAAGFMSGAPFNRCTQTAFGPDGDLYVSDGYGNAAVHRFDAAGRHRAAYGSSGIGPGELNLPHGIVCHESFLYIADRENHRIQIWDLDGRGVDEWSHVHRPTALTRLPDGGWVVAELGPMFDFNRGAPNLGPRLSILSAEGTVRARLQLTPSAGDQPGQFVAPHDVAVDAAGAIYVAQVVEAGWSRTITDRPMPATRPSIVKLVPLPAP